MIQVYKIPIAKDKLRAMPADERALLILLGYAANQINYFSKLALLSSHRDGGTELEQMLVGAQTQMTLRVVIGVLNESWRLIHSRFMGCPYAKEYIPLLDEAGAEAFTRLRKELDASDGLFSKLRNRWIFHHPRNDDLTVAFEEAANNSDWDRQWHWYFSNSNYNSFYMPSEFIALQGVLNIVGETDLTVSHTKLVRFVISVSDDMSQLIMAILKVFLQKYFIDDYILAEKRIDITDAPNIFDVWIPFFVDIPDIPEEPPTSP